MSVTRLAVTTVLGATLSLAALAQSQPQRILKGDAAYGGWQNSAPGTRRLIAPGDMPRPYATRSVAEPPRVSRQPRDAELQTLAGFTVKLFARGLDAPREIQTAPNGDVFVAESRAGRIRVLRPSADGSAVERTDIFATGLDRPFGIAFYPVTGDPQWIYIAETDAVVRFPYRTGDLRARGKAETVVDRLPTGGHWTRDVRFSNDGSRMFVSVGSGSNAAEDMRALDSSALAKWASDHALGAAWGPEQDRADVLSFTPDGKDRQIYATGLRNCAGLAVDSAGAPWCATNERDGLGDNLPPDYVTRVRQGAFYGWPWYYIGNHQDPRHAGQRPDLAGKVTVPDVLIQPHSAPLQMVFYNGGQFPAEYRGSAFVTLHGSWNRDKRTGYKIIRIDVNNGNPTGVYQDFVTGFVTQNGTVWGRPVGITVAKDGSLLFSEDGNGTIWRVAHGE
jgi:glucose/arabinose dehydrogenase